MTKAWIRNDEGPAVLRLVDFKPWWSEQGERPVHEQAFTDGELRWYGSGTAVADMRGLPITIRMPFLIARGRVVWGMSTAKREELVMALRKVQPSAAGGANAGPGVADAASWPHLLEYLTETKYPDGSAREPSALIIVADGTGWRGCVSDKDNARTLWKTADSVEGLLLALEEALASDDPTVWRQSAAAKFKGKKRG